jgi:hypothetical protein
MDRPLDLTDIDEMDLVRQRPYLLYKCDQDQKLISTNEPGAEVGDAPPVLFMSFGSGVFVHHYRRQVTDRVLALTNAIIACIDDLDKTGSDEAWAYIHNLLTGYGDFVIDAGPAFIIPREVAAATDTVEVTLANREVLKHNFPYTWAHLEHLGPCTAQLADGQAVAICRSIRKHANLREGGVDTLEAFRGRGYGAAVVSHWAKRVWEAQQIPCYSTQWENHASRALAKKIKLRQYAIDISVSVPESA